MSVGTYKHGEDYGEISVRDSTLLRWIVQNLSPGEKREFVIFLNYVKCMHKGQGETRLRYTKTVRWFRLHVWEREEDRED